MTLILDIAPKPQSRPRFTRSGRAYEDREMQAWRSFCRQLVARAWGKREVLLGPLRLEVCFYIQPPKYLSSVRKNRPFLEAETLPVGKKPDIDNYEKALYDSMSGIVFQDDGQIAGHAVKKVYSLRPRIEVVVSQWNDKNVP